MAIFAMASEESDHRGAANDSEVPAAPETGVWIKVAREALPVSPRDALLRATMRMHKDMDHAERLLARVLRHEHLLERAEPSSRRACIEAQRYGTTSTHQRDYDGAMISRALYSPRRAELDAVHAMNLLRGEDPGARTTLLRAYGPLPALPALVEGFQTRSGFVSLAVLAARAEGVYEATKAHNDQLVTRWVRLAEKAHALKKPVPGPPRPATEEEWLAMAVGQTPSPALIRDVRSRVRRMFERALAAFVVVWIEVRDGG